MINRENQIKIGRAGGNTSNWETPDLIGRVGISVTHGGDLSTFQIIVLKAILHLD